MIVLIVDSHAHLDSPELETFLSAYDQTSLRVVSNSVSVDSSVRNLDIAKKFASVVPFVGIHPEIFRNPGNLSKKEIDNMAEKILLLSKSAKGIGEIGLDPNYGRVDDQRYLFTRMLEIAEKVKLPISIHSRDATSEVLELISTRALKSGMLFHWFTGDQIELKKIHALGIYTSFGPSIIFSKRMGNLIRMSDQRFILAETDSPTRFRSLLDAPGNPTLVSSVVFQMSRLLNLTFDQTCELTNANSKNYLSTQD